MKVNVNDNGVLIPRHLLGGAAEVEIRKENGIVVVIPVSSEDPILGLGSQPVSAGVPDASAAHDRYLYDDAE